MTTTIDWRELKKELLMSPLQPRTSMTFKHNDIFSSTTIQTSPERITIIKNAKDQIPFMTPKRVRETNSTRSQLLDKSDVKNELKSEHHGLRCFESKSTIFQNLPIKRYPFNPHKIPDHTDEWFYQQNSQSKSQLRSKNESPKPRTHFDDNYPSMSSHRLRKQEELYKTEVASFQVLSPDGSKLNLQPGSKIALKVPQNMRDQSNERCLIPSQRRLQQNRSSIFGTTDNLNELTESQKVDSIMGRGNAHSPKSGFIKAYNPKDQQNNSKEVNHIKRVNQNFSDIFGLEYGARESLQSKKQTLRDLSQQVHWANCDSIVNSKDIGSSNKTQQNLNQSRSRLYDQKSSLDTHNEYLKPIPKTQRLVAQNQPISKSSNKSNCTNKFRNK